MFGGNRMSNEKHSRIEQRAREIWQREGCPDGRAEAHWKQAEEELARESEQAAPSTGAAPYVPGEGPMMEPDVGSPVIAGVSAPSTPPIPAGEAEERKAPATETSGQQAPYVPVDEAVIEPQVDAPVIAGVSATSTPPIPAEEVEERKRAAKAKPAAVAKSAAAPARPGATKTAEPAKAESKPAPSKPAADTKKATKKKG
jgi:Protein of unknown function (DUF2934)